MQHPMESVTLLVAVGMVRCGLKLIYPIQCTTFELEHFQIFSPGQSISMLEHQSNKITLS